MNWFSLSSSQRAGGGQLAREPSAPSVGCQSSFGRWLDGPRNHWHQPAGLPLQCHLHASIQLEVVKKGLSEEGW